MDVKMRKDLTPQGYIRRMYAETQDGKCTVEYENPYNGFCSEKRTFFVNWTEADAEETVQRYNVLTSALARIARLHDQLKDEENRTKLLSQSDLEIYNTYVHPYDPMEVDWDELYPIPPCEPSELMTLIQEIHERSIFGDLIPEEELLWKQYCMWNEAQSQKRIPFNRHSCADLITRASRYERLISLGAPEIVVTEEGCLLAEEMVLYYFGKDEPIIWE